MSPKKLPETDEERIDILQTALELEESGETEDKILSAGEARELRLFLSSYEGDVFILNQVVTDRDKAVSRYNELFKNARLYISNFIQVLFMTVIRNEIRAESLPLYGFSENDPALPDLSTEEAVLKWGEQLMSGESERICLGGIPLYNPAIAKVKVHYELFKETMYSLAVYDKNLARLQDKMKDLRLKADEFILDIWTKVEERYSGNAPAEQNLRYKTYKIQSLYKKGEQLNVFN